MWRPLDGGVDATFENVHYVHTDSVDEYTREVGALSRAVIEGLTPLTALAKHRGCYPDDPQKRLSINLLEACLLKADVALDAVDGIIQPLRRVQSDRLPGAHRSTRQVEGGVAAYKTLVGELRDAIRLLSDLTRKGALNFG